MHEAEEAERWNVIGDAATRLVRVAATILSALSGISEVGVSTCRSAEYVASRRGRGMVQVLRLGTSRTAIDWFLRHG